MSDYLKALSECIKQAAMYGNKLQSGYVAKLIELSAQPQAALVHYMTHKRMITDGLDTIDVQAIEDYLTDGVKQ